MIKTLKDTRKYNMPWQVDPRLIVALAWYATEDDSVLGVVVRDRLDQDFGWVALTKTVTAEIGRQFDWEKLQRPVYIPAGTYRTHDVAVSRPTAEAATTELHAAMERIAQELRK